MHAFISSIGTALPSNRYSQTDISQFMLRHLPLQDDERKKLELIYRASGIHFRHSVIPDFLRKPEDFTFFPKSADLEPFPQVKARMQIYEQEAIRLCIEAAEKCLGDLSRKEITHVITVSCTGMYAPGIDIELIESLGLNTDVERTAINFMGCYGSFNALKAANHIIGNNPKHKVLLVSVELCSIHLLKKVDEDSLLSNALFSDGAAAVLLESKQPKTQLAIMTSYSDLALAGKQEMAWHISDFGFEMKLTTEVPDVIRSGIGELTRRLLSRLDLKLEDIDLFAIHPGGRRILQVIEEELHLEKSQNGVAYEVLRNHGNMSSATVLFVLKGIMEQLTEADNDKNLLSFAFGPGLTLESMLYKISIK